MPWRKQFSGDPSASRWPIGCGEALLVRYHTGHGAVAPRDQVQFEIAAAYRQYQASTYPPVLGLAGNGRRRERNRKFVDSPLIRTLLRWAMRKFKRFKAHKIRASHFLQRLARDKMSLFVHWRIGMTGTFA